MLNKRAVERGNNLILSSAAAAAAAAASIFDLVLA